MSIFDNTKIAFADKSTKQLKKAYWMFKAIGNPTLTNVGVAVANFAIQYHLPFAKNIIKNTLFEQFCGGETREECLKVVDRMWKRKVGSILDYSVEGKSTESSFDHACAEILEIIEFSQGKEAISFVVFKPSGFGRIELFEKIGKRAELTSEETEEWARVVKRFDSVCAQGQKYNIKTMIDAEETWLQEGSDILVEQMMEKYNKEKPMVWNTVQMYRTGRIEAMQREIDRAREKGYKIGYKLVRGAYMEKERERAKELGYPSPIQPTKQATDDNYNHGIAFVMSNFDVVSAYFGSHNEQSVQNVMSKIKEHGLPNDTDKVYFGQLYGMSDNITYYLASENYNVNKYLPYGPVKDVVPYLARRAQENTSARGQSGRELSLIKEELKRRSKAH